MGNPTNRSRPFRVTLVKPASVKTPKAKPAVAKTPKNTAAATIKEAYKNAEATRQQIKAGKNK